MRPITKSVVIKTVLFLLAFISVEPTIASIKDGEGMVYEGSTATIALADTYKRTLRKATSVTYSWSSENTYYMAVTSSTQYYATIRGVRPTSSCKLFFKCSYYIDGHYRTMDIYYDIVVKASSVSVTNVYISPSKAEMKVGGTIQLTESVYPANATNRNVNWMSNDNTVASVNSSGLVKAKSPGTATITCIAADGSGCRDYCFVTVQQETSGVSVVKEEPDGFRIDGNALVFEKEVYINVYRLDGRLVFSGITRCLDALDKGIYIVKVDGEYKKVMVK